MSKRTTMILAGCVSAFMALYGTLAAAETLRVGSTPTSVPFTFLNPKTNKVEGVMSDVIAEIAKEAGFEIDVQAMPFSSLIPALTANKIDIIAAAMFATPARAEIADFTDTVYSYGETLFVSKTDTTAYKTFADLKGEAVGAQIGTVYVNGLKEKGEFSEVKAYDSIPDIMADVNARRIKAGFGDYPVVAYQLANGNFGNTQIVKAYEPSMVGSISIATRKGNPELVAKMNKALEAIKSDGRLDGILKKWGLL